MRMVYVEWLDSYSSTGWQELDSVDGEPLRCRSVGWLLRKSNGSLVLAPHISDEGHASAPLQGNGLMTIPSCAVSRMVELQIDGEPERV